MQASEFVRCQVRLTAYSHEDAGWIVRNSGVQICLFSPDFPRVEGGRNPLERVGESLQGCTQQQIERYYCGNFIDLMGRGLRAHLGRPEAVAAV